MIRNKSSLFFIIWVACFSLTGCQQGNGTQYSSEINEEQFTKDLENRGVELKTHNGLLPKAADICGPSIGSDSYETLLSNISETHEFKSSRSTSTGYTSKSDETIENQRAVSVADQTPHIYTLSGNYHYPTGLCSNVVGVQAKSASNITIKNCIFENMSGVSLWNCSDVKIENCYFKGAENGVYLAKCTNITIKDCTFDMNATGLTDYYQGVYLGDGNDNVTISNCYFKADADIKKPYRIGSTSTEYEPSKNITFDGCISEGHFRSGFQNIDGIASLKNCVFFFDDDKGSYGNAIIIDDKYDATYTTLTNCSFYVPYRKKLSPRQLTAFNSCIYNLFLN